MEFLLDIFGTVKIQRMSRFGTDRVLRKIFCLQLWALIFLVVLNVNPFDFWKNAKNILNL